MAAAFSKLPVRVLWRLSKSEVPDESAITELNLGNNTKVPAPHCISSIQAIFLHKKGCFHLSHALFLAWICIAAWKYLQACFGTNVAPGGLALVLFYEPLSNQETMFD